MLVWYKLIRNFLFFPPLTQGVSPAGSVQEQQELRTTLAISKGLLEMSPRSVSVANLQVSLDKDVAVGAMCAATVRYFAGGDPFSIPLPESFLQLHGLQTRFMPAQMRRQDDRLTLEANET